MLMMLGPVAFEIAPLNAVGHSRSGEYPFAEHDVLGTEPVYENMGGGGRTFSIKGITFPNSPGFTGGAAALDIIESLRLSGTPQHLLRGDFTPMGWFLIRKLTQDSESLGFNGVGGKVAFEISLTQCGAPDFGAFGSIISGFFS
ncbi:phage tail protein [Microvirga brassicacearum]|uniref:Phage tail protein n=1 Tax=Microvirga brassicacearum TaxID=2580413 RepID=A0A5N3PHE3_9HYPH|nr:phage tail protein [Microvirga brassicacearum]KAB0269075.1 hypothetical protein FEZ63_02910 [Microvirga brassicacearum]